jgi:hypothetical protein
MSSVWSSSTRRRAARGSSRCSAAMSSLPTTPTPIAPIVCCCSVARGRATCSSANCCRAPTWRRACAGGPRSRRRMLQEVGVDGLIALSGAAAGDVGEALLQGNHEQAASARAAGSELFPAPSTSKCSAMARRSRSRWSPPPPIWRPNSNCRWSPRIRSSFSNATTSRRTRRGSALPRATCSAMPRRPSLYTEEQYFKSATKWSSCLPIFPKRSRTRWRSPSAAICRSPSARATCRISRRRTA